MRCRKNWVGLQDKPARQLVTQAVDSPQRCKSFHRRCLEATYNTGSACSARRRRRTATWAGKIPCNCRWIPVKKQLFPWAQKLAFVHGVLNICIHIFWKTAHSRACHGGHCKVLKLQLLRSVLDPIRGQCYFLSYSQICMIQEVTDQRRLPILWRLNWNQSCLRDIISKNWTNLPFRWNHSLTPSRYKLKWL